MITYVIGNYGEGNGSRVWECVVLWLRPFSLFFYFLTAQEKKSRLHPRPPKKIFWNWKELSGQSLEEIGNPNSLGIWVCS